MRQEVTQTCSEHDLGLCTSDACPVGVVKWRVAIDLIVEGSTRMRQNQIESILSTIWSNATQIESMFTTIESILRLSIIGSNVAQIELVFYHNRVNSGDAHNTFFESTILKQTAYHMFG